MLLEEYKTIADIRVEKAEQEGRQEGIQALILDYLEEGFSKEKIISKLQDALKAKLNLG